MKNLWKRLISGSLALLLAGSLALPGLAAGQPETPSGGDGGQAQPLAVTVGTYTPRKGAVVGDVDAIQKGESYTLIALPASSFATGSTPKALTPAQLVSASGQALFIGSAVASANGQVTFENVRLRTAEAAVYYVTGPGLSTPLAETTGLSTSALGTIRAASGDRSALVALVDADTGYHYGNRQYADAQSGSYYFDQLAPGIYDLYVTKPGYLPTTHTGVTITDGGTTNIRALDISANVGDVTNDGVRDLTDLSALLLYYGKAAALAPSSRTPDLSGDGMVDQADVDLLIPHLTTGSAAQAQGAAISVTDTGTDDASTLRSLTFSISSEAPVSAAAFSITYSADTIQPLNEKGGMVSPVDGGTLANCLVPAPGYTAVLTGWKVSGNLVTLSFGLTSDTPHSGGAMAQFYYRPVSGNASSLYPGVFALDQAAVLVGRDTVVTAASLTYPNCDSSLITSLVIDQRPDDGHALTMSIPAAGQPSVMALTATGSNAQGTFPSLPGVTWRVTRPEGGSTAGISAAQGQLTVTSQAAPGRISITAVHGDAVSEALLVDLEKDASVPAAISILKNGQAVAQDETTFDFENVELPYIQYGARVLDQYGAAMSGQSVTWTLSGAPTGVSVGSDGRLTASKTYTPAGTYNFSIRAQCGQAQAVMSMTLTVRIPPKALSISGTRSAVIPAQAGRSLTLNYVISAVDLQDKPMSIDGLAPSLTVSPANRGVTATCDLSGTFVTVSSTAPAGVYTLTAQIKSGEETIYTTFDLTLATDPSQTAARAVLYLDGQNAASQTLTFESGRAASVSFTPRLLNSAEEAINNQPSTWSWLLTPSIPGLALPEQGAEGVLSIASTLTAGSYHLEVTATEHATGLNLSVKAPVTLVITPVLTTLRLTGPATGSLALPVGETLTYTLAVDAADAHGQSMEPPKDLAWSVTAKGSAEAPAGVSISDGVLTVTPAAKAGVITVTVSGKDGSVRDSTDITLTAVTSGSVLTLSRTVTLDGKVTESGPVSGGTDTVALKEGSSVSFAYTASLVDQSTGETRDVTDQVTWLNGQKSFAVDANAETGVYASTVTAVYAGQSVSATAQAAVYPHITDLRPYFGEGTPDTIDQVAPPYTLTIPVVTPRTYSAKLMAVIQRDGESRLVPLSDLGLTDYELSMSTPLSGISATVDKSSHSLLLTVEPSARNNSMDEPASGAVDTRYIALELQYFPGETLRTQNFAFRLERDESQLKQAIFRYGAGSGTIFAFDTAKAQEALSLPAGALTGCYALELRDQYNLPVVDQEVTWRLAGFPQDGQGNALISIYDPGDALSGLYNSYASMRRLAIHPDTPAGTYDLTLSVEAADYSFSQALRLTVGPAASDQSLVASLSGKSITIPQYFAQRNSTELNNAVSVGNFLSSLAAADGSYEVYPLGWQFAWDVQDQNGNAVTGVSAKPAEELGVGAVTVTRDAKRPSGTDYYQVLLTATSPSGQQYPCSAILTLTRDPSIPYLIYIVSGSNGRRLTSDTISLTSNQSSSSRTYECRLVDQYNYYYSISKLSWSLSGNAGGTTTMSTRNAANAIFGGLVADVVVRNNGSAVSRTVSLIARADLADSSQFSTAIDISVRIQGNNTGGGGGGGSDPIPTPSPTPKPSASPSPSPSPTPSVAPPPVDSGPSNVTLTPPISQSGSSGSASLTADQEKRLTDLSASGGTVTIAPSGGSSLTSVSVSITAATANTLASQNKQSLRVQTSLGTVLLSPESLKALASRGGSNAVVTLSTSGGVLKIDFTCGSTAGSLPGAVSLSAPTSGNVAIRIDPDGTEHLLKKAVVSNGRILTYLNGSTQLRLEDRTPAFSDTGSHWAKSAIDFTAGRELFQGTTATTFSPDSTMTRSMLVTVLHRLEDTPASGSSTHFADVPGSAWYSNAVTWANANGIVQGTSSGFKPDDPVTREQLATILYRYMTTQKLSTSGRNNLYAFTDRDRVSSWARDAVEWAVAAGLIQGKSGGILDPGGNATRAEVSTIMERLIRSMAPTV